jgi:hypothetical protein
MDTIIINGRQYEVNGPISMINDRIYVNGQLFENGEALERKVNITIVGGVHSIKLDKGPSEVNIKITGNVGGSITTTSGDVEVAGNVLGDVKSTSGDIKCKNVTGSVRTVSGGITCSKVAGNADTVSGDINSRDRVSSIFEKIFG